MAPTDPLAALPPLAAPAQVSWWPPAPGWWLLALFFCIALAWLLHAGSRLLRRRHLQRWIQGQLDALFERYKLSADRAAYLHEANLLLRRIWLAAGPVGDNHDGRNDKLDAYTACDQDWLALLDKLSSNAISGPAGMQLLQQYQPHPDADIDALDAAIRLWCKGLRSQYLRAASGLQRPASRPRRGHRQPGIGQ